MYEQDQPIWGMNYFGAILNKEYGPKQIYPFLREALRQTPDISPFRGPQHYQKDTLIYNNSMQGQIHRFSGQETILVGDQQVYRAEYHGGLIIGKE